jgi:hypothetical protein
MITWLDGNFGTLISTTTQAMPVDRPNPPTSGELR